MAYLVAIAYMSACLMLDGTYVRFSEMTGLQRALSNLSYLKFMLWGLLGNELDPVGETREAVGEACHGARAEPLSRRAVNGGCASLDEHEARCRGERGEVAALLDDVDVAPLVHAHQIGDHVARNGAQDRPVARPDDVHRRLRQARAVLLRRL